MLCNVAASMLAPQTISPTRLPSSFSSSGPHSAAVEAAPAGSIASFAEPKSNAIAARI
jgi:hypothetical protein